MRGFMAAEAATSLNKCGIPYDDCTMASTLPADELDTVRIKFAPAAAGLQHEVLQVQA